MHICAPNALHFEMVQDSLKAGKHVVCEKPPASTVEEAEKIVALAKAQMLLNCTLYNVRSYPQVQNMRRMCAAGDFGEILVVQGTYSQDWLMYDTDWNWCVDSGPSRALADIGTHWCDLVEHVTGRRITAVFADLQTFYKTRHKAKISVETFAGKSLRPSAYDDVPVQTEDFRAMIFRMGEKTGGCMTVSQVAAGRKNRLFLEIYGSESSAAWNAECPDELWLGRRNSPNQMVLKDPSLRSMLTCRAATARATMIPLSNPSAVSTAVWPTRARLWITPRSRTACDRCSLWRRFWKVRGGPFGSRRKISPEQVLGSFRYLSFDISRPDLLQVQGS